MQNKHFKINTLSFIIASSYNISCHKMVLEVNLKEFLKLIRTCTIYFCIYSFTYLLNIKNITSFRPMCVVGHCSSRTYELLKLIPVIISLDNF